LGGANALLHPPAPGYTTGVFVQKQITKLFSNYIRLCDFWRQNFVEKLACKKLMKLAAGKF